MRPVTKPRGGQKQTWPKLIQKDLKVVNPNFHNFQLGSVHFLVYVNCFAPNLKWKSLSNMNGGEQLGYFVLIPWSLDSFTSCEQCRAKTGLNIMGQVKNKYTMYPWSLHTNLYYSYLITERSITSQTFLYSIFETCFSKMWFMYMRK